MAEYESEAPPSVTFTFHEEGPRIVYSDGRSSPLPAAAFARSRLLREMCESEGLEGQRASVNLSPEQVYTWLAFIEPMDEHALVFASDDHLVTVLKAADVLIDERTLRAIVPVLAGTLLDSKARDNADDSPTSRRRSSSGVFESPGQLEDYAAYLQGFGLPPQPLTHAERVIKIMGSLSCDLAISIIQATNATLPTLFSSLPGELHPLALRTHIPSVDSNRQLCIEHQDMSSLSLTMVLAAANIRNLTKLSFHQRHLLPETLEAVFSAIGNLTNLRALNVSETQMGREGARRLAPLLSTLPHLQTLDVAQARVGDEGAIIISQHLSSLSSLETLDMSLNVIGDDGIEALALTFGQLPQLQVLNLARNSITAVGAQALAATIHHLHSLRLFSLKFNDIGVHGINALAPQLTPVSHLQDLDLEGNGIGEIGASAISTQFWALGRSLKSLKLGMNRIGEVGTRQLACTIHSLVHLEDLGIGRNELRDNGVSLLLPMLSKLGSLTCLSLYRNMITAVGVESVAAHLPSLTALQTLDLSSNDVGDSGALALAAALPQSGAIHTVKLVRCKIYVIGARAFADTLGTMTNLQVLDLRDDLRDMRFAMNISRTIGDTLRCLKDDLPHLQLSY